MKTYIARNTGEIERVKAYKLDNLIYRLDYDRGSKQIASIGEWMVYFEDRNLAILDNDTFKKLFVLNKWVQFESLPVDRIVPSPEEPEYYCYMIDFEGNRTGLYKKLMYKGEENLLPERFGNTTSPSLDFEFGQDEEIAKNHKMPPAFYLHKFLHEINVLGM